MMTAGDVTAPVALRKESVDRNRRCLPPDEIRTVALRKESVDRNPKIKKHGARFLSRSPQGERG